MRKRVFWFLVVGVLPVKWASAHEAMWQPRMAVPLTEERVAGLPVDEQLPWRRYLEVSRQNLQREQAALKTEADSAGRPAPVNAPLLMKDFKLAPDTAAAWFGSDEAVKLAETLVSYQTPTGGWSKEVDYSQGPRKPGMSWSSVGSVETPWNFVGTFDNKSTTGELFFLASVYRATGQEEFRKAFDRGLAYIAAAQFPNGGWPQIYPLQGEYHDAVTFNDHAMTLVLELLRDIAAGKEPYTFVTEEQRRTAADLLARGIQFIVKAQVQQDGRPTIWAQQHDPLTLQPVGARLKEPPALAGLESSRILELLMSIKNPSPEIAGAVTHAHEWYERSGIQGLRQTRVDNSTYYENDPESQSVWWARFYDPVTNKPIFCGSQDGIIYDSFEDMWKAGNRATYVFYSSLPAKVVGGKFAKWKSALTKK